MPVSVSNGERITGALSAAGSFAVVITYLLFKPCKSLRYIELVFYMSLNLMIASIGIGIGATHSIGACWFQTISTNLNYLSAILWSNVMTIQVYLIVYHKRALSKHDMNYAHAVCWGLPTLSTFLPLIFIKYGNNDDQDAWCFFVQKSDTSADGLLVSEIMGFYLWLWLSIIVNFIIIVLIGLQLRRMAVVTEEIRATLKKLLFYPVVLVLCWIGATIVDLSDVFSVYFSYGVNYLTTVLCIIQGLLIGISFFVLNDNVRCYWLDFIYYGTLDSESIAASERNTHSTKKSSRSFFDIADRPFDSDISQRSTSEYDRASGPYGVEVMKSASPLTQNRGSNNAVSDSVEV